jgi:hypothetical protein
MKTKDIPLHERVTAGSGLLDEVYGPTWQERIDVNQLSLEHCDRCILGQLEGGYTAGLERLGIVHEEAVARGFDLTGEELSSQHRSELFADLTSRWRVEIAVWREARDPVRYRLVCAETDNIWTFDTAEDAETGIRMAEANGCQGPHRYEAVRVWRETGR